MFDASKGSLSVKVGVLHENRAKWPSAFLAGIFGVSGGRGRVFRRAGSTQQLYKLSFALFLCLEDAFEIFFFPSKLGGPPWALLAISGKMVHKHTHPKNRVKRCPNRV